MKLFESSQFRYTSDDEFPRLLTPLGELAFDFHITPCSHSDKRCVRHYRHHDKPADVFQLEESTFTIELLSVDIPLMSTVHADDLKCRAFLLRIEAFIPIDIHVRLGWLSSYQWIVGCGEPSEGIEAKTWKNDQWKVTIGTENEEYLAARARVNQWMPSRLVPQIQQAVDSIVNIKVDSVAIKLHDLLASERCQLQFVVASNRNELVDDISTWLAVSNYPSVILQYADFQ